MSAGAIERWTWHGGGLRAARARFAHAPEPWIDLSTGINPHGWPHDRALAGQPCDWARLPDERELLGLEAAAADYFGVDPAFLCAVPGTEIGLRLIEGLIEGPAHHATPSYRTHAEMLPGSRPIAWDRLADADGATLVLANPNNPDGRLLYRGEMRDVLGRRGGGWLLVDEAFADTAPAASIACEIAEDRRLLVFRSFGKFFGLAGVRLGFVLGPPAFLARLRRKLGAWPLSAPAIAIGAAAYRDRPWIEAMRLRLPAEAAALDAALIRCSLEPAGACPLFRLVEVDDAHALFDRLAARAILTRPFAENPRWLRIGLPGDAAAVSRLEAALRDG